MKTCLHCNTQKNENDFSKNKTRPDGLQGWCKTCSKQPMTEKLIAYKKSWKESNPEKIRISYKKSGDRYRKSERGLEVRRIIQKKRKAMLRGAFSGMSTADWLDTKALYGNRCVYCNELVDNPTQDHVVPVSMGGAHTKDNVVPSCRRCNSSKGTKPLIFWLAQKVGFSNV